MFRPDGENDIVKEWILATIIKDGYTFAIFVKKLEQYTLIQVRPNTILEFQQKRKWPINLLVLGAITIKTVTKSW